MRHNDSSSRRHCHTGLYEHGVHHITITRDGAQRVMIRRPEGQKDALLLGS